MANKPGQSQRANLFDKLSKLCGNVQKKHLIQGILAFLILCVPLTNYDALITNFLGVIYPLFMSIQALESEKVDEDKQWLTYWLIYGLFSILDLTFGFVFNLIPFYYFLKLLFLIWLAHPSTQGATLLFYKNVEPYYREHEKKIDAVAKKVEAKLKMGLQKAGEVSGGGSKQD